MAENVQIPVNQKLFLSRDGKDWYVTSVEDKGETWFLVGMPYQKSQPLVLHSGERVTAKFAGNNASYQFITWVNRQIEEQVTLYELSMPESIERVQQRNFVRVPISIPVKYALEPEEDGEKPEYKNATSVDLSAGGMKIAIKEPFKPGVNLLINYELEINKEPVQFNLKGTIVRIEVKRIEENYYIYHAGVKFTDINRGQQDKIMAFLFAWMAKQKRVMR